MGSGRSKESNKNARHSRDGFSTLKPQRRANGTFQEFVNCEVCFLVIQRRSATKMKGCTHYACKKCILHHIMTNHDSFGQVRCFTRLCTNMFQPDEISAILGEKNFDKFALSVVRIKERQEHSEMLELQAKFNKSERDDFKALRAKDSKSIEKNHKNQKPKQLHTEFEITKIEARPSLHQENSIDPVNTNQSTVNLQEYQEESDDEKRSTEDAETETQKYLQNLIISKEAMQCPKCSILIMKDDGCSFVTCPSCELGICFLTQKPRHAFTLPDGRFIDGCHCMENDTRCHPQCTNCH